MIRHLEVSFITPTFYLLPKIHKNPRVPPGRPIVSGMGGLCDAVCKFIDFYLQPLVETLPSHVRDTSDVLRRLNGLTADEGILLVTLDVETLYTNICHEHGLRAVEYFLSMSNWAPPLQQLILELLEFILTHNVFTFGERFYLQRRGTAMGAACAPSYANLFLGYWEREVFGGGVPASSHAQCWLRFIDDIFVIWGGTTSELEGFVRHLNSNSFNIYLTFHVDPIKVDFLDINISLTDQRLVSTDIYRKPSSVNALLHASSGHPKFTINAIPTGQFIRLKRICSETGVFEDRANEMRDRFRARGYSTRSIKKAYKRARSTPRDQLLLRFNPNTTRCTEPKIRFVSSFNRQWEHIRGILSKHWPVLQTEPVLRNTLPDRPLMTARRGRSLRDMLVHSHYSRPNKLPFSTGRPLVGSFPCGSCIACRHGNIVRATSFTSSSGARTFDIRHYISCNSTGIIYYATCNCNLIYVGLTSRELKVRTREHVRDIIAAKQVKLEDVDTLKTIPRHFRVHHRSEVLR
ncbi:uncharacterized protein ACNLHF_014747 isoform 1-T1 [Anomaloglossus baeobatrachus]|uniref:uncharacterized protein LOC142293991 n=1 Tax=Anomaloglossus baeobatrachus TaxID=238106 RepID=UPI003F503014